MHTWLVLCVLLLEVCARCVGDLRDSSRNKIGENGKRGWKGGYAEREEKKEEMTRRDKKLLKKCCKIM